MDEGVFIASPSLGLAKKNVAYVIAPVRSCFSAYCTNFLSILFATSSVIDALAIGNRV